MQKTLCTVHAKQHMAVRKADFDVDKLVHNWEFICVYYNGISLSIQKRENLDWGGNPRFHEMTVYFDIPEK